MMSNAVKKYYGTLKFQRLTNLSKKQYSYLGLLIVLIALATLISSSFSRDSDSYNKLYEIYGTYQWNALFSEMLKREVFFLLTSKLLYLLGLSAFFLFLIYAAISVSIKFYLIGEHSQDKLLSLAFFVSYFFILHDSTQIRFSLAIAFSYFALHFLAVNRKFLFAIIIIFSAILFHAVSLIFIVMLFFKNNKSLLWLSIMVVLAIVLYSVNLNEIFMRTIGESISYFEVSDSFINKVYRYLANPSSDAFLGMFSRSAMLVYLCAIVIFQYRDKFSTYELLCYNSLILSIFFYILLKDMIDLQVRIRDLFGFSLVFLMPYIHRGMSVYIGQRNAYILLYLYLAVHLVKFAIYDKMIVF